LGVSGQKILIGRETFMFKLSKKLFTAILLVTVLMGSLNVQAATVNEDSKPLEHNTITTEKDLDKDFNYYDVVFENDAKELSYPVEVEKQGVLLITLQGTDPNFSSLTAQLYEDAGLTKKVGKTIYLNSGTEEKMGIAEVKKAGTYYIKLEFLRKYDYKEPLSFNLQLDLIPGGTREIKKDVTSFAYQDYDTSENLYKIVVNKTGLVTLNIAFDKEELQSARFTLLNSQKKAISEQVGVYTEKDKSGAYGNTLNQFYALTKGTYYVKVDARGGLHTIKYTLSNVTDKSGASLSKAAAIKVGGSAVSGICTNADKKTKEDWYKFTLSKEKAIKVSIDSKVDGKLMAEVCDSKGKTVWYGSFYLYSGVQSKEVESSGKWSKGTYYIKVYKGR
jgi:hypothetical protein